MTTSSPVYHHCDACGSGITTDDAPVECAACRPPDIVADIREFHERFGLIYTGAPRTMPEALRDFRLGFLEEELDEYEERVDEAQAMIETTRRRLRPAATKEQMAANLADQLDALVDLVYVAVGCAYLQGFDFNEAWRRVHVANMSKVRAAADASDSRRGSSFDVVKPPGWQAPDHLDLVADHAHVEELAK